MTVSLTTLRRLAEQHSYAALREACLGAVSPEAGVQVLLALANACLGDQAAARCIVASLDRRALDIDGRVDLAAVYCALEESGEAVAILESARRDAASQDGADHPLLLARLGWWRVRQERWDEALALYAQSLALKPRIAVYGNLLQLFRDSGRLDEMAACLDTAWRFWAGEQESWPERARQEHSQQLRGLQLDLLLDRGHVAAAESWIESERDALSEEDWCALLTGFAHRLAAGDCPAAAEEWLRNGLGRYPENPALHAQLAELANLQGRPLESIALLYRAIRLTNAQRRPADVLWARLSAIALPFKPSVAREAAVHARDELARCGDPGFMSEIEIAERHLRVQLTLAGVDAREQNYDAAEYRYRRVLEQRPDMVPALQGLAQVFMQLGRVDEAVALFERVRGIDPARGHGALIHAHRFPEDDDTLHRLERLARASGMEGSARIRLLFQLAAAWENREAFDRAFALADEANAASRRLLRYDPKAHRQRCARLRHAFPHALYEHRPGRGHESPLPVFVVGMPRSGTTLVEQILAGHSRIHGAGELGTIPRVIAGLERWERRTGSGRRYPDCVDDLDPQVSRGIAGNVLKQLRDYAPDADHVVDKLPHNFENIGLIKLLFPRARIISVRRDPRDVAVSNYFTDFAAKHSGMGFAYDLGWIGEQLADHNLLMHHWQQVFPGEILEIHYERLVDDPETSARRMLEYIGVDWEPQVLDFDALARPVRTASVWQVRQPLYSSSKARWQRYRGHLEPLLAGARRKITWDPIEMVTLPEPGWMNAGVDHYNRGEADAAEYRFKQLLRYLPEHAAGRFMLGLIYVDKGHCGDGIALMEQAVDRCPWNRHWRRDLAQAYRLAGRTQDASALINAGDGRAEEVPAIRLDYLFLSGKTTCSSFAAAPSGAIS